MALSRRSAAPFFSAFYKWHCFTVRCTNSPHYTHRLRIRSHSPALLRGYTAVQPTRLEDQPSIRPGELQDISAASVDENFGTKTDSEHRLVFGAPPEDNWTEHPAVSSEGATDKDTKTYLETQMRRLMRRVPSSVAVVTAAGRDEETGKALPIGIAISSFNTVSMDPPMVSFNVKQPSKTLEAIRAAQGLFRVHFILASPNGAKVIQYFTQGNDRAVSLRRMVDLRMHFRYEGDDSGESRPPINSAPLIHEGSVMARLDCTVTGELQVADHVILVARVDSLTSKYGEHPLMMYVNGNYASPNGIGIKIHNAKTDPNPRTTAWSPFDYPLFPGYSERLDYVENVKSIIKSDETFMKGDFKQALKALEARLQTSHALFGINLQPVLWECRNGATKSGDPQPPTCRLPALCDFYGRLTPIQRTKLTNRLVTFVQADPRFLQLPYEELMSHLNASLHCINLIPSDFTKALREADLIGPQRSISRGPKGTHIYTLEYLEQVEHKMREFIKNVEFPRVKMPVPNMLSHIGEAQHIKSIIPNIRTHLMAEHAPERFNKPPCDIAGEIGQEELRVIMSRFLQMLTRFQSAILFQRYGDRVHNKILREIGVDPRASGMDIDYLIRKIWRVTIETPDVEDWYITAAKFMEPWFTKSVSSQDLHERVKSLVQKMPLQVMIWSKQDQLAAMGLDVAATFDSDPTIRLDQGLVLDKLIARELKNLYGKSSEEEDTAIAKYLKDRYNYNISELTNLGTDSEESRGLEDLIEAAAIRKEFVIENVVEKVKE